MKERLESSELSPKEYVDWVLKEFLEDQLSWLALKEQSNSIESEESWKDAIIEMFLDAIQGKVWVMNDHKDKIQALREWIEQNEAEKKHTSEFDKEFNKLQPKVIETILQEGKLFYRKQLQEVAVVMREYRAQYVAWPLLDSTENIFWRVVRFLRSKT